MNISRILIVSGLLFGIHAFAGKLEDLVSQKKYDEICQYYESCMNRWYSLTPEIWAADLHSLDPMIRSIVNARIVGFEQMLSSPAYANDPRGIAARRAALERREAAQIAQVVAPIVAAIFANAVQNAQPSAAAREEDDMPPLEPPPRSMLPQTNHSVCLLGIRGGYSIVGQPTDAVLTQNEPDTTEDDFVIPFGRAINVTGALSVTDDYFGSPAACTAASLSPPNK